ncbi:MAG: glycogen debranching protein, partial [Bacteroidota bacterium]
MKVYSISLITVLLTIVLPLSLHSQSPLYHSEPFSVYPDSVVQGKFTARAHSNGELSSNYKSDYRKQTQRDISFKFCINGLDNERMPGQDHHFYLYSRNGKIATPLYEFGKPGPKQHNESTEMNSPFLDKDVDVTFRVDMRNVLKDLSDKGYFVTFNGEKISASKFKGVFIAGGVSPLTWNFATLGSRPEMQLQDPDGDGVYEITLRIPKETYPGAYEGMERRWKLSADVSPFPRYESPQTVVNALYNMSLEELMLNIRPDGALMAGESWTGVWTRDISYSIILSLAIVHPDASKISLLAKVKDGRIIQDTGTGGSWPVSTDRMVWSLAAWEVYAVTGDRDWLKQSYDIIRNSAEDDLHTAYDTNTKLFYGESSFLDWREQTYPRWMDPKDIYQSKNLGTNIVHYQTYRILSRMGALLGEKSDRFDSLAQEIKESINTKLWSEQKKYYGQYLYGRIYPHLSERSEALGEALAVLYGVAGTERQRQIIENVPVTKFGVPCIYPYIPNIPPYHNNAVWPFVETYWAWASATAGNTRSVSQSLASIYRSGAMFLTNKENLVATSGDYLGTEINSNRQLWSVAGTLATVYRVIFGMDFQDKKLVLHPFVPGEYVGDKQLKNFKYRNAILTIILRGTGNVILSTTLDGKPLHSAEVPSSLTGEHILEIVLSGSPSENGVNNVENEFSPETPLVSLTKNTLHWKGIDDAVQYRIFRNGQLVEGIKDTMYELKNSTQFAEYQIAAVNSRNVESFLSEPAAVTSG